MAKTWDDKALMELNPDGIDAKKKNAKIEPRNWGIPGYLTKEEVAVYRKFEAEIEKRGGEFRETVFNFGDSEEFAYCLCRWLRARKFDYDEVIKMIDEAVKVRVNPRKQDFYPDPTAALGVDPSIFIKQFPQLYTGTNAKIGCPLFISQPGRLNMDGMACITTPENIIKFHWHIMTHDYGAKLRANKEKNPDVNRFESLIVMDLDHLTINKLRDQKTLDIIKEKTSVDSLCFPETMFKMVIVNAPIYFSATWTLIKGWLDPRTRDKIEVISSRSAWEKKLKELVDEDQLPSDYGGKGESTDVILSKSLPEGMSRQITEVLVFRTHGSFAIDVKGSEEAEVIVYTRGTTGGLFSITNGTTKEVLVDPVDVTHVDHGGGDKELPSNVSLTKDKRISGPLNLKVKADSKGGRFSSENFLIVFNLYKK